MTKVILTGPEAVLILKNTKSTQMHGHQMNHLIDICDACGELKAPE